MDKYYDKQYSFIEKNNRRFEQNMVLYGSERYFN
jgi:hypothetical protein